MRQQFLWPIVVMIALSVSVSSPSDAAESDAALDITQPALASTVTVARERGSAKDVAGCAATRSSLTTAMAQDPRIVTCVEYAPPDAHRVETVPLPQWCNDFGYLGWASRRTESCMIRPLRLNVYSAWTGQLVGVMDFLELNYSATSTDSRIWAQQIELRQLSATGLAIGTSAQGTASCTGFCTLWDSQFPSQPMVTNGDAEGGGAFYTTISTPGSIGSAFSGLTYWFTNPTWVMESNQIEVWPPRVRCDNATPGARHTGCVFPDHRPVHTVSLSGPAPNYARHIFEAQASGLPGGYPNGLPLTRLTDTDLSDLNGDTACPRALPRPDGYSCDEYPFRSTWEGAFTRGGPGRTRPWCQMPTLGPGTGLLGWSACMIPAVENSKGGSDLGIFYRTQRVLEREPFYVWVTA